MGSEEVESNSKNSHTVAVIIAESNIKQRVRSPIDKTAARTADGHAIDVNSVESRGAE
ncbi:hypothetical protein L916_20390 [Phytophthora nicotianae]|uniref:Uncharacterized protein n=1 Tax=Phytophthora nicotianae TaxID=4792 RepID=W2HV51_PHYNI|nr:hypothetical protein L916_20390 [Phytophthora nicotianae]